MKNEDVDVTIHDINGKRGVTITVTLFDSLREAYAVIGEKKILEMINKDIVQKARSNWRNRFIKELVKK